jgi:hypothetical protein
LLEASLKQRYSQRNEDEKIWNILSGEEPKRPKKVQLRKIDAEYYCGFHSHFVCDKCYFKDHENTCANPMSVGVGSIKSLLTREYQQWGALSQRVTKITSIYEQNLSKYGQL